MSRGYGATQRAILTTLSDQWIDLEGLARAVYGELTPSHVEGVRRALTRLLEEAAVEVRSVTKERHWLSQVDAALASHINKGYPLPVDSRGYDVHQVDLSKIRTYSARVSEYRLKQPEDNEGSGQVNPNS